MKRHKKLVSLLIALAFVFSLVPMAAANVPADADGAAARLNALGIIEGYPDGTFGLNRDITRAEFAKIAVIAGGYKEGAEILKGTPSRFSDVKTDVWYTGWINMAAAKGLVKGDPAGTFRPNDRITNAEVVTVLMRLLGYDDRLPGGWPINYLVEAATLEVTKGLSVDAKSPALRGNVFVMASRVLDATTVTWNKDNEKFAKGTKTLVAENFESSMVKDVIVTSWQYNKTTEQFEIKVVTVNDVAPAESAWIPLKKDASLVGAADAAALRHTVINYLTNKDGEIVWAQVQNYGRTVTSTKGVKIDNVDYFVDVDYAAKTVKIADKTYKLNTNAVRRVSAASGSTWAVFEKIAANYRPVASIQEAGVLLDKDGKVVYLWIENPGLPGIFKEYNPVSKTMTLKNAGDQTIPDFTGDNKIFRVVRDGKVVSLTDLKENDQISFTTGSAAANGYDVVVTARSATATGKLTSVASDMTKITVGGKEYNFAGRGAAKPTLSTDNGENYIPMASVTALENLFDKDVVVGLDRLGKVVYVRGVGVTTDLYAVVNKVFKQIVGATAEVTSVELVLSNGSKVAYAPNKASEWAAVEAGQFVKYGLEANGKLSAPTVLSTVETLTAYDNDLARATVGGRNLFITDATVVWDRRGGSDNDEITIVKPADFKEGLKGFAPADADGKRISVIMVAKADVNYIQFIVVNGPAQDVAFGASGADTYGVVTGKYYSGKYYLSVNVKGVVTNYEYTADVDAGSAYANVATGDLVKFDVTGGKIGTNAVIVSTKAAAAAATVERVDLATKSFRLTTGQWIVCNDDTVVYNVAGTTPAYGKLADLTAGTKIDYAATASGVATWIVVK
ncbi:MAG: S-layer homology domain-containing protein [Bacillota bacterium]